MSESAGPLRVALTLDSMVLVTLASALLFVAGWGYAEEWFAGFDLGLVAVGLPIGYFGIYGYEVLVGNAVWLLPLVGLGTALLVAAKRRLRGAAASALSNVSGSSWSVALAPVLSAAAVLVACWAVYTLGQRAARQDFEAAARPESGFCGFPYAHVFLNGDAPDRANLKDLEQDLANGLGRLLIQSGDLLVIILPHPDDPSWQRRRPTVVVPASEVRLLELKPVPEGCRRR